MTFPIANSGITMNIPDALLGIESSGAFAGQNDFSFESIDTEAKSCEAFGSSIIQSCEKYRLISNTKAMESFGYKSTEAVMDNVRAAAATIKKKFLEFLKRVQLWLQHYTSVLQTKLMGILHPQLKSSGIGEAISKASKSVYNATVKATSAANSKEIPEAVAASVTKCLNNTMAFYNHAINTIKVTNKAYSIKDSSDMNKLPELFNAWSKNCIAVLNETTSGNEGIETRVVDLIANPYNPNDPEAGPDPVNSFKQWSDEITNKLAKVRDEENKVLEEAKAVIEKAQAAKQNGSQQTAGAQQGEPSQQASA